MNRTRPLNSGIGALTSPRTDPGRDKPEWLTLGGYFKKKGKGDRGKRSSSVAQQKINRRNRGSRHEEVTP